MSTASPKRQRVGFVDHLGLFRSKYIFDAGKQSTRFCQSVFGVHFDRDLLPSPASSMMEGLPDVELYWQPEQLRESWEDNTDIVVSSLRNDDGNPFSACPRNALQRAVDAWQQQGLTAKIGIELEAYAFAIGDNNALTPIDDGGTFVYATGVFADQYGFCDAIYQRAMRLGFDLELITTEFDAAQYEFTLSFKDAMAAVDELVLFRLMAREVAFEHGVLLTFLPKPLAERGGSGMHINFSLFDDDNNAISNGDVGGIENMSELAKRCVAGLVEHHQGLAGVLAPTQNSYQRLQPASLSGYWQNWGGDHRNVTTRVSGEGGKRARIEHRMADASANPYLAVAAVLQAALLGWQSKAELGAAETGDGFERNNATVGVAENLEQSLQHLSADQSLVEAIGSDVMANHLFMKQEEYAKTKDLQGESTREPYLWLF